MNTRGLYPKMIWRILPLLLILGLLNPLPGLVLPAHASGTHGPYVVDIISDGPDSNLGDGACYEGANGCSLRAAIQQASSDAGPTTITFAHALTGSTLLVESTYGTIIWAGSNITLDGEDHNITISGQNLTAGQSILQIQGSNNLVRHLTFRSAPQDGIQVGDFAGVGAGNDNVIEHVTLLGNGASGVIVHGSAGGGGTGNIISGCGIGASMTDTTCSSGNNSDGVYLDQMALDTQIIGNNLVCNQGYGVMILGVGGYPTGVVISTNWIGTNGTTDMGNAAGGIRVDWASGTQILTNTIAGNGVDGIWLLGASNAVVTNNAIGVIWGTTALPNDACGVIITNEGHDNHVGGTSLAERNLISGNAFSGICLEGGASKNFVDGNYIGTNEAGTAAVPNLLAGISIIESDGNYIGSSSAAIQLISGNTREGIYVENSDANLIAQSNYIGVGSDLTTPLSNGLQGILLNGANSTFVAPGIAAHNGGAGLAVVGAMASGNEFLPSDVHGNGGLPIDLGDDGATPNDAGDGDSGPNGLLNYPEITGGSGSTVNGTVCSDCTVLIYHASGNPRAAGGGGTYVTDTVASAAGNWSLTLPGGLTAADITTVACESPCALTSNTSEMSPLWGGGQQHYVFLPLVVRNVSGFRARAK